MSLLNYWAEYCSTKTDGAIFKHALASAHVKAFECIFIDNAVPNLAVPREMGRVGVHFDNRANDLPRLIDELLDRGVLLRDAP